MLQSCKACLFQQAPFELACRAEYDCVCIEWPLCFGCSSDTSDAANSPRRSQIPKLPNLPSPQKSGQAPQPNRPAVPVPSKRTTADRLVVVGTVTQPSRKSVSESGSSSFSSRSTSSRSTARGKGLPVIASAANKSPPTGAKGSSPINSPKSVQQQQEVARASLQQSRAAAEQEKARIKNSIQQQLRPGKMLF